MGFDFYGLLIVLYILRQVAWRRSITLSLPVTDRRQYMETNEQQIQRLVEEWHRRTAQGELDAVLGLMTEDAAFPQMYKPSHDEEGIRSRLSRMGRASANREQVRDQRYPCPEMSPTYGPTFQ